jgi:hypothetical protein
MIELPERVYQILQARAEQRGTSVLTYARWFEGPCVTATHPVESPGFVTFAHPQPLPERDVRAQADNRAQTLLHPHGLQGAQPGCETPSPNPS